MRVQFLLPGILGNVYSALIIPHRAESGPSGGETFNLCVKLFFSNLCIHFPIGHFALMAAHIVEVINAWSLLRSPFKALGKLLLVASLLFILGTCNLHHSKAQKDANSVLYSSVSFQVFCPGLTITRTFSVLPEVFSYRSPLCLMSDHRRPLIGAGGLVGAPACWGTSSFWLPACLFSTFSLISIVR